MARAQRSQLLLEALAAAAEHKRLFFLIFFLVGLVFFQNQGELRVFLPRLQITHTFPSRSSKSRVTPQQDITRDGQVLETEAEGRKGRTKEDLGF